MARLLSILLVVGLLGGTAAAFAVTESLKLERSPIFATRIVNKVISPVCECETSRARIRFALRKRDRITVTIVREDTVVRTLKADVDTRGRVEYVWDGRDDAGGAVPEGSYKPRVHLDRQHKTIVLPNPIDVDVTPPSIDIRGLSRDVFSPDGDGRADGIYAEYELSESAHALTYVNGQRVGRTRFAPRRDQVGWFGKARGQALPAGRYRLSFAAEDLAGNVSSRTRPVAIRIRYVELGRRVLRVRALARFGIRVRADARVVRWRFAGATGRAAPGLLRLRAPRKPGRYRLFVAVGNRADTAIVRVRQR